MAMRKKYRHAAALMLLTLLTLTGCRDADAVPGIRGTGIGSVPADGEAESPLSEADFFTAEAIPDEVFERMRGISYPEDCPVPREELRYLRLLYVDFDGNVQEGELICNYRIAHDLCAIFKKLYRAGYPIEKIRLIDDYGGADDLAMEDDNTSCFNYRTISHTERVSKHGLGLAVDVNPLYNPFVTEVDGKDVLEPESAEPYADRTKAFPHKIDHDDLCWSLFTERGFEWGGDWVEEKDYQHFELPGAAVAGWYEDWIPPELPDPAESEEPAESDEFPDPDELPEEFPEP